MGTLVKKRVKQLYNNLKEQLQEGDSHLQEGLTHEKDARKEGDDRLEEELDEDVTWLKGKLAKERRRVEDELTEGEATTNKEITELKEAFEKLQDSVKQWTQSAVMEDLKQMPDFQAELNSTQHQLQTNQHQLQTNQQQMKTNQQQMKTNQQQMKTTEEELNRTRQQLQISDEQIRSLRPSAGSTFVR
ncbi:uncharacterized protein LOC143289485 [Babylonia areolata]|uniref:uncharacterized protein LOC143289485 n=1 Tax=Babylonia areolata TaxID=304850 RepID=UPI003FD2EED6